MASSYQKTSRPPEAAGSNRRMRQPARPVVWEGAGNQPGPRPDPFYAPDARGDGRALGTNVRAESTRFEAAKGFGQGVDNIACFHGPGGHPCGGDVAGEAVDIDRGLRRIGGCRFLR